MVWVLSRPGVIARCGAELTLQGEIQPAAADRILDRNLGRVVARQRRADQALPDPLAVVGNRFGIALQKALAQHQ